MTAQARRRRYPISTYRLQFRGEFGFREARDILPYLGQLGITDCYSSPHLKANPGSSHGYDICDHSQLNPELGTREDYAAFSGALVSRGFGHIVDVVPNHMAADPTTNAWWRDVLEHGPSSMFSDFFDIDWDPVKPELKGRVLLPVLGDQYGRVLEQGDLALRSDAGTIVLAYGGLSFPLNPRELPRVLRPEVVPGAPVLGADAPETGEYLSILTALANLCPHTERDPGRRAARQRESVVARERLARLVEGSPRVRDLVNACLRHANGEPGHPASFDVLHDLLEHQAYRLAYWRTAFDEVNYRRFFDVNGLVALRMEDPRVFDATHAFLRTLVAEGHITGFRVDHPDGLFDPQAYLERLERTAREAEPNSAGAPGEPSRFYVVVEKILSAGEALREDWPVAGTTGYEFLNLAGGLCVDGRHAPPLRRSYARVTGHQARFADVAYECKRVITLTSMAGELSVLAHGLNRLSEADRRHRDFTLDSCRKALREVLAGCGVYRTYISERGVTAFDRAVIEAAIEEALRHDPVMEESIFDFIRSVLLPAGPAGGEDAAARDRRRFAMKLQQFSGPVQAKGVEDTAFYRHHVLIAANDVGGHPGRLGVSADEFHEASRRRQATHPFAMLATATHDTKRGEDARARLSVLSEVPDEWRRAVSEWTRLNARHRSRLGTASAPDRNEEYLCYQAMLGAWPAEPAGIPVPDRAPEAFVERIDAYMQKAVREAKVHTSWIDQDQEYGQAVGAFVRRILTGKAAPRFLASFVPFARRIARVGAINSLAQVVLKVASPGVPDFYQGTELWDLSLVDPDNRRLVDFEYRRRLLDALTPLVTAAEGGHPAPEALAPLLADWHDGRIKLLVTACALRFRRDHAAFMARAEYLPLAADGPLADHVVAFARRDETGCLLAIVPRLSAPRMTAAGLRLDADAWRDTRLRLPAALSGRRFRHVVTGESVDLGGTPEAPDLDLGTLFESAPVALLAMVADSQS
jgi:(1->4)-alpha-D-glucan 1-alpha-D-glucosylmutase